MNIPIAFARTLCLLLSLFYMCSYTIVMEGGLTPSALLSGVALGLIVAAILIAVDLVFRRFSLRAFNTAIVGLFFGYLMGFALTKIFHGIVLFTQMNPSNEGVDLVKILLFLFGVYLGLIMTIRAADELYLSIPFVRFSPTGHKVRELVLDGSILADPRILDLATSGLFNNQWILPRFILRDLYSQLEESDELVRSRARRSLDTVQKLEGMSDLGLRINESDFPDVSDIGQKTVRLARLLEANLLTADLNKITAAPSEGVLTINIHGLSNALKPLMEAGQFLNVKIQRYGKEPRQGVGYLEDGTMVVVNGGGDFIGEEITTRVLSVKHTTSGRMIFCNVIEE